MHQESLIFRNSWIATGSLVVTDVRDPSCKALDLKLPAFGVLKRTIKYQEQGQHSNESRPSKRCHPLKGFRAPAAFPGRKSGDNGLREHRQQEIYL